MEEIQRVRAFLRAIRRRAILEAGLRGSALTIVAILASMLGLALCAAWIGPAAFWPTVTLGVLLVLTVVGLGLGWLGPLHRLRTQRAVAALVGRRHPPIASDLISAVELDLPPGQPPPHGSSPTMVDAFQGAVGQSVGHLNPRHLVPMRGALRAGGAALAVTGLFVVAALGSTAIRKGLGYLTRSPTRFEGATVAREPLMGDVRLTYTYPKYTGLPRRVVEGSSGDIVGIKGTQVRLEGRLLRSAREALLIFGDKGESAEVPVRLEGGQLVAELVLDKADSYRVYLAPLIGRPVREHRSHRIVVEPDNPPQVDLMGPADRLELPTPRPVELAFAARDDFGLGAVDLIYRVDDGPEQRVPLRQGNGARSLEGKTVFEPDLGAQESGARVAYRVEAKDRDDVSGAKSGSSRTLYLLIQNPRESIDEDLAREREILDRLLGALADRLELLDAQALPTNTAERIAPWLTLHEAQESHLALLGRLVDEQRRAGTATKTLVATLAGIADRLGRQMRDERTLLGGLRARTDKGQNTSSAYAKLVSGGKRHIDELETSVLLLDDLIGRQRLEDLAALGRELTSAYKRLQDLLSRYNATKDESLRRQLEREIRAMKSRIEDLARKIAEVKSRNEISTEWQNMPDLKAALEKTQQLDELLQKGDPKSMAQALDELGQTLESLQRMLEGNADEFANERFAQENRTVKEMTRKLGDLEGDQRGVAGDTQSLAGDLDAETQKRVEAQLSAFMAGAKEKIEELRKRLASPPPREIGAAAAEDLHRAQDGARQLRKVVPARDWGEAAKELERVTSSVKRVRKSVDDRSRRSPPPEAFAQDMNEAGRIADELRQELQKLMDPEGSLTPQQRERARGLAERQQELQQRTSELAEEIGGKANQIPGADKAQEDLRQAAEQMGQGAERMGRGAAREGATKAQDAAERLAQLRDGMGQTPMSRGLRQREPVRIPGADESKAPREWRQELLEAMRGKAPERYREEVRRYYEELVK